MKLECRLKKAFLKFASPPYVKVGGLKSSTSSRDRKSEKCQKQTNVAEWCRIKPCSQFI